MDFCNIYDETNLKKQLYDTEILKIKETNNKESEKEDKKLIGQKIKSPNNRK